MFRKAMKGTSKMLAPAGDMNMFRKAMKGTSKMLAPAGDLNGDGIFQKNEADNWWLNGKGVGVTVDNSKIDWTGLKIP